MKIGLTYDLRSDYLREGYSLEETAEFDKEDTIDGLEAAIRANGHKPERIGHARALIERLAKGERWDLVFNIAEGLRGIAREAQVPAILDVYGIPCVFSDAAVLTLCLHKGYTKALLRQAGVATAPFKVVEGPSDIADIDMPYPLFVKPVAEGTGKGVSSKSIVRTKAELRPAIIALLEKFKQPVLVEPYLSGREFTVGILGRGEGTRTVGAMEVHLLKDAEQGLYSYSNKENFEGRVEYSLATDALAKQAERVAREAWIALGCRDGGRADLRAGSDGKIYFLEVNPLAGLNPTVSDLVILWKMKGGTYTGLIGEILKEAIARIEKAPANAVGKRAAAAGPRPRTRTKQPVVAVKRKAVDRRALRTTAKR
jgi:D-alanine-D-alanine ligase